MSDKTDLARARQLMDQGLLTSQTDLLLSIALSVHVIAKNVTKESDLKVDVAPEARSLLEKSVRDRVNGYTGRVIEIEPHQDGTYHVHFITADGNRHRIINKNIEEVA